MKKGQKILTMLMIPLLTAVFVAPVNAVESGKMLTLGGTPFGLKLFTEGVMVINTQENAPADKAGIERGDIITKADGETVESNEQLSQIIADSRGSDIELTLERDKRPISVTVTPEKIDGDYAAGMWIRDSTAGIGTLTYFDESTLSFGALGHGITDKDTGNIMPLSKGEILSAQITDIAKAQKGVPGGLVGEMGDETLGEISVNNDFGIYGRCKAVPDDITLPAADDSEIEKGNALIYTTVDKEGREAYEVQIEQTNLSDKSGQNMVIRVTDERLLEKTGGIIQGMSGSPIVQNGKIIGAVTHVFVNTPQRGYGITISNMLENYAVYGKW